MRLIVQFGFFGPGWTWTVGHALILFFLALSLEVVLLDIVNLNTLVGGGWAKGTAEVSFELFDDGNYYSENRHTWFPTLQRVPVYSTSIGLVHFRFNGTILAWSPRKLKKSDQLVWTLDLPVITFENRMITVVIGARGNEVRYRSAFPARPPFHSFTGVLALGVNGCV